MWVLVVSQEFHFGHVKLEVPIRHPGGDVTYTTGYIQSNSSGRYKSGNMSCKMSSINYRC